MIIERGDGKVIFKDIYRMVKKYIYPGSVQNEILERFQPGIYELEPGHYFGRLPPDNADRKEWGEFEKKIIKFWAQRGVKITPSRRKYISA